MSANKKGLGPPLVIALSVVVLVQSAALAGTILHAPNRQELLDNLRSRPVETVVELCVPAKGQNGLPEAG